MVSFVLTDFLKAALRIEIIYVVVVGVPQTGLCRFEAGVSHRNVIQSRQIAVVHFDEQRYIDRAFDDGGYLGHDLIESESSRATGDMEWGIKIKSGGIVQELQGLGILMQQGLGNGIEFHIHVPS